MHREPISRLGPIALTMALLPVGASLAAQEDWRMPFRAPESNLVPPEPMYEHLRPMFEISLHARSSSKSFVDGVEVIDDPVWKRHHDELLALRQDAGYLSSVIRDSRYPADRRIAFYGAFFIPQTTDVFNLIRHIPGEPLRELREEALMRAVEYLAVFLPRINPGDLAEWNKIRVGPAGQKPPRPGDYTDNLDLVPFAALLALPDEIDKRQVLWFLARCSAARPAFGMDVFECCLGSLRSAAASESVPLRAALRDLLDHTDPKPDRKRPAEDASTGELRAWLDAVDHDLLPPIRRISAGLVDLYDSDDLDRVVRVGKALFESNQFGATRTGKTAQGAFYRGVRINQLPEPLELLGLKVGTIITAVNGTPVGEATKLFELLQRAAPVTRSFLVEYVDEEGGNGAIEFRRRTRA